MNETGYKKFRQRVLLSGLEKHLLLIGVSQLIPDIMDRIEVVKWDDGRRYCDVVEMMVLLKVNFGDKFTQFFSFCIPIYFDYADPYFNDRFNEMRVNLYKNSPKGFEIFNCN